MGVRVLLMLRSSHGATDDGFLRGAHLGVAFGALGGGQVVDGGAALATLAVALVVLAAAVAGRGGPARRAAFLRLEILQ